MTGLLSRVIVPVNGAESSIGAVRWAIALSKAWGSMLKIVYVVDTNTIKQLAQSRIFVADESAEFEQSLEETGKRYLSFARELAREKRVELETALLKGSVVEEVVRAAADFKADGIILGGAETAGMYRDIIVEENRELVRMSRVPVVIVRGGAGEELFKAI